MVLGELDFRYISRWTSLRVKNELIDSLLRSIDSPDLLATLATKRTPVLEVKFSPRNLALAAGAMIESS